MQYSEIGLVEPCRLPASRATSRKLRALSRSEAVCNAERGEYRRGCVDQIDHVGAVAGPLADDRMASEE